MASEVTDYSKLKNIVRPVVHDGVFKAYAGSNIGGFIRELVMLAEDAPTNVVTGEFNGIRFDVLSTSDWRDICEIYSLKAEIRRSKGT